MSKTLWKSVFEYLCKNSEKPALFQTGERAFWDDPHISQSMLEAHLNPEFDGASRRKAVIDKTIDHLMRTYLKEGDHILDLGCGPGLYSTRFCQRGLEVTGIDLSQRSVEYAKRTAQELGLAIRYICGDFFDLSGANAYDAVLQIYGELCTFDDTVRNNLLQMIHILLKPNGLFIFDVSTRRLRKREGLEQRWYLSDGGFWRPDRHIVLEQGFDYPEADTWVNQYVVASEEEIKTYRLWFHDYSLETITEVLAEQGFVIESVWNDLTGAPYSKDGDWIAIAARKR